MKTDYDDPDRLDPHPLAGDKIQFERNLIHLLFIGIPVPGAAYKHVGIADGEGGIYHLSGEVEGGLELNIIWKHNKIAGVARGDRIRINNSEDNEIKPLKQREIIRRCKRALKKGVGEYHILNNNCEHVANQMRYGRPRSKQAEKLQRVVDGALLQQFTTQFNHLFQYYYKK